MLKRYMVVEGVPGVLVSDDGPDPRRFVGQQRIAMEEGEVLPLPKQFVPIVAVKEQSPHIVKAVRTGQLKQHGQAVLAENADAALAAVMKKPAVPAKG